MGQRVMLLIKEIDHTGIIPFKNVLKSWKGWGSRRVEKLWKMHKCIPTQRWLTRHTLFKVSPFIKVRSAECPTMMINITKMMMIIKIIVIIMMMIMMASLPSAKVVNWGQLAPPCPRNPTIASSNLLPSFSSSPSSSPSSSSSSSREIHLNCKPV